MPTKPKPPPYPKPLRLQRAFEDQQR